MSGGYQLKGRLHLPEEGPRPPVVIGSHGLLSTGESPKQIALARQCNAEGMAFFRFDHRGCGKSQGPPQEITSLSGRCEDLLQAALTLQNRKDVGEKLGLFGSSMGGAVSIAMADTLKPNAMVTYAAPIRSRHINGNIEKELTKNKTAVPSYDPQQLKFDISDHITSLNHILIIHGEGDKVVPISHARMIFEAAQGPKELIVQKGGDHPMSNSNHQKNFIEEAVAWFKHHLH